jgi:hypothetical protein
MVAMIHRLKAVKKRDFWVPAIDVFDGCFGFG